MGSVARERKNEQKGFDIDVVNLYVNTHIQNKIFFDLRCLMFEYRARCIIYFRMDFRQWKQKCRNECVPWMSSGKGRTLLDTRRNVGCIIMTK